MLTFSDLIKNNIAPSPYKTNVIGNELTENDRFVINYNNIWGVVTDTHMSKGDDGNYYITGQLFRSREKTEQFLHAWSWGGCSFKDSSMRCQSLWDYIRNNYKTVQHEIVNGDDVLVLRDFTEEQREYVEKYYKSCMQGAEVTADWKQREEDSKKNADVERSLIFKY